MLRQNNMPAPTTKWQAMFEGASLAQPMVTKPARTALAGFAQDEPTPASTMVTIPPPEMTGGQVAIMVGTGLIGAIIGVAVSYGICCWAMKNCG